MSGIFNLGDATITTALTNQVITDGVSASGVAQSLIDGLDWMAAVTIYASLIYGSGGTTVSAIVQTSIDQGANWIDVARFDFTTANASKVVNLSGLLSKAVSAVSALGSEGVFDGVLGDRLRCKLTTTGVYSGNTSVSIRAAVR
ncbi:hypothetical protein [Mesorhizobium sp. B263B2A]|uniref:hypothetical protein n=1 Tax=Mesorhizobium sp. B263B2A TaxID=2876669 RepID=UPI001CD0B2B9|nr:hypothetical protein [Mesorhizobium sp. B263B2A]MCA0032758.1 hypothetical protein [Mesorhizobium sp. B263B2A]